MSTSRRSVEKHFLEAPKEIQGCFEHLPKLLKEFPLDVSLGYLFSRVEYIHNMALYCGATKLRRTDSELTWKAIESHQLTRDGFREFFTNIYENSIPDNIIQKIKLAEKVRDKALHGKTPPDKDIRPALVAIIDYANSFNDFVYGIAGLRPFTNNLTGYKGRGESLDKRTTRLMLQGLGFKLS